jgi:hypothetical protein
MIIMMTRDKHMCKPAIKSEKAGLQADQQCKQQCKQNNPGDQVAALAMCSTYKTMTQGTLQHCTSVRSNTHLARLEQKRHNNLAALINSCPMMASHVNAPAHT